MGVAHYHLVLEAIGDVPANAQLDDLGIEAARAVNGISHNWFGHLGCLADVRVR